MKKVIVLGVSAGVGKSTFAKKLGELLHMNVCHLDSLFWKPGWTKTESDEFKIAQQNFIDTHRKWIIEGNYSSTYDLREKQADTIIYLQLPLIVCLYRVIKRWLKNRGKTRSDMGKDCPEKLDWEFIRFICTTYHRRKKKMAERFKKFRAKRLDNKVYILKSKQEIRSFLNEIASNSKT